MSKRFTCGLESTCVGLARFGLASLLLGTAALLWPAPGVAASWVLATGYPKDNFHTQNIARFAEDVRQRTGGSMQIDVRSNGSFVSADKIRDAVRSGKAAAGEFLLASAGAEFPVLSVDALPFLATSYHDARALWNASRKYVTQSLGRQGLTVLFSVPWPPQGLYTAAPVSKMEDLRGRMFRTQNATTDALVRSLGGRGVRLEQASLADAFAQGQINAMFSSSAMGIDTSAWKYTRQFYNLNAWIPKNVVVANARALSALDAPLRKALMAAAAQAEQRGWSASEATARSDAQHLENNGLRVLEPSPYLMVDLKRVGKRIMFDWSERAGGDGALLISDYYLSK